MNLVSRNADFHPPLIERVRKDWRHVQLERLAPQESWLSVIVSAAGLVLFMIAIWGVCR